MDVNTGLFDIIKNSKDSESKIFRSGEFLYHEKYPPKGIYCIEKGSVKLFKKDNLGRERIIYLATCGEIVGLHSVVNNHPYAASAQAISDCHTLFISLNNFMNLVESKNVYKLLVMKSLCSRIDSMEEHILGINEKITQERFADALLMLINKYGIDSSNKLMVNLTLDELASFTCTSKSYMKKVVSDFSSKGLVSISSNVIKILNLPKIQDIANQV